MKRIIVIIDSIDVNDSSGAKANVGFVNSLQSSGNVVYILHYSNSEIYLNGITTYRIKEKRSSVLFLFSRIQRVFQRVTNFNINKYIENYLGFSLTYLNDVNSIKSALAVLLKEKKVDLIITLSQASSFRPHAAMLYFEQYHFMWLAYVHDPYPMACYPRPYDWVESGHYKKYKLMHRVLNSCRYIGYPSQLLSKWMSTYYLNHDVSNSVIIPHQKVLVSELADISIPNNLNIFREGNFTLLHAGSLMDARNPTALIEAFVEFIEEFDSEHRKKIFLVFVGKPSKYSEYIKSNVLVNESIIISEDYIDFNISFQLQKLATANVIIEADAPFSPFLPGKFTHCVQANKTIFYLGPVVNECIRILGNDYPFQAEINDKKKIKNNLRLLYNKWEEASNKLELNRPDVDLYLSSDYLNNCILKLDV